MPDRWVGIVVTGDKVTIVDAEVPTAAPLILQADETWPLQKGDRGAAYHVMYRHVVDYVREQGIKRAIVKASAVARGSGGAHLASAELRGVVIAAAASVVPTGTAAKAHISRNFGERKVDEYVADDSFWASAITGAKLRQGSREAAMLLVAAQKSL